MIAHFKIDRTISLNDFFAQHAKASLSYDELLQLGCFYVNNKRVLQTPQLRPDDYLRLHLKPRRFPIEKLQLDQNIVDENQQFLIFNKPSGLPVHATLDNYTENILYALNTLRRGTYWLTHRLDIETSGLILFAKTKEFQKKFNQLLQQREVSKEYVVFSNQLISPGKITHYMKKTKRAPKELFDHPHADSLKCELEILSAKQEPDQSYRHNLQLITGRTHQIRAQFSKLGAPILGDELYGGSPHHFFGLKCIHLQFEDYKFCLKASFY